MLWEFMAVFCLLDDKSVISISEHIQGVSSNVGGLDLKFSHTQIDHNEANKRIWLSHIAVQNTCLGRGNRCV